ncbi:NACHT domain-containing protein [Pseudomonas sp. 1121_17]|uniref:NACHT domain-containing protein n=1 Tax=Pseudomonas sp. 1121_17 TaxID=2604458 RepID=UPI0040642D57
MDSDFLPRTLWRHQSDEIVEFEHSELDSLFRKDHRPLIILGEAGMGKTALLKWLADTHGYRFVTTRHLSLPLAPIHPLDTTQVLVIDALDELAASSSTDALLKTLVSLANLGYPRFILSCRASDWRDAESAELFESLGLYDKPHLELHLKALTDEQVQQILRKRLGETGACNLIAYLRARRLDDWLGNPHTLGLIMGAAASGSPLPEGRAGLFELAISQSLSEHKPSKSAVAPTERDALDAAGAACTALILGDFDSISRTSGRRHALPLKEASELPGGGCLSQVLGTRLFDSVGVDSFNYTHRSLGEYLAARWLSRQADSPRKRRRLFALFHRTGLVPASLRGVHGWLALYPNLMSEVISTDPIGVIEYGDPERLALPQVRALLLALGQLASRNPGFIPPPHGLSLRGLIRPGMESEVVTLLEQPQQSFTLRLILLQSIKGTGIADKLVSTLQTIVRNCAEFFAPRRAALEGLYHSLSTEQSYELIQLLTSQDTDDGARLGLDLAGLKGYASFDDADIVKWVIACAHQDFRVGEADNKYDALIDHLPKERISRFLDCLTEAAIALELPAESPQRPELANLVMRLTSSYFHSPAIVASDLLRWLQFATSHGAFQFPRSDVHDYLENDHGLRRALQQLALLRDDGESTMGSRHYDLGCISNALWCTEADAISLLDVLDPNELNDERWRSVVTLMSHSDDQGADLRVAARAFASNYPERLQWLDQLPLGPTQEAIAELISTTTRINDQERERKRAELLLDYQRNARFLRDGRFEHLVRPAMVYLGRARDYSSEATADKCLAEWLDKELAQDALSGFEAYLQRIPCTLSSSEVAGFYSTQDWFFDPPEIGGPEGISPLVIIAAISERHRIGMGFSDLTDLQLITASLAFRLWISHDPQPVRLVLDAELQTRGLWREALRLAYEPRVLTDAGSDALDELLHYKKANEVAASLAAEWLHRLPSIPCIREKQLVKMLLDAGEYDLLKTLTQTRRSLPSEHQLIWDVVELAIDFEKTADRLAAAPVQEQLLDYLRYLVIGYYHGTDGHTIKLDVSLVEWTISNFRSSWPHSETPIGEIVEPAWFGSNEGGLAQLIHTLGSLTTPEAIDALTRLSDAPRDTYTTLLLDAKSRQQRLCHESTFTPPTLGDLIAITRDEPPRSSVDLQAWVIEELRAIQAMIKSDDIDSWRGFYLDDQINHQKEDRCRDYLLALLRQGSAGVVYDPEKHIAADKEVDIMCSTQSPSASLPIEIKGQWHPAVWDAADRQLDRLYTTDHKAGGLGIYLVLWFGKHARLQGPGRGVAAPSSPEEMAQMLQARCQAVAQGRVKIVVLDLARNTVDA